jgi:hypothetical protein
MYSLTTQPWLLDLHGDPRFQALLEKMRLPGLVDSSASRSERPQ